MKQSVKWNEVKILIAEDEKELREVLCLVFESKGAKVFTACDGLMALEILKDNVVDIVLSDVRMPKCDGVKLLEAIRANNPDIPVVFLATGFADISEDEAKQKGAASLLEKPFKMTLLFSAIENALIANSHYKKIVA